MRLIHCDRSYSQAILDVFNEAIENSTALYEYRPRTNEFMEQWFEIKRNGNYPILAMVDSDSRLMGFASYGPFRNFPAYKYTVEHSLYVAKDFRGCGVGLALLQALIEHARAQDYHVMVGGIDSTNVASIALHKKLGFQSCGQIPQVGYKFDRWLDLCFYQLILETPAHPSAG